ncbi:MAG: hypothetical protein LBK13_10005 [Spirochaetales bacterium]|nr:hypothetical protein [Spirochaetales bacterium]
MKSSVWTSILMLSGCSASKYQYSIKINTQNNIVFNILKNYPNIIPGFHNYVKTISQNRTQYGITELIIKKNDNKTEYTVVNHTKVPFYIKKGIEGII